MSEDTRDAILTVPLSNQELTVTAIVPAPIPSLRERAPVLRRAVADVIDRLVPLPFLAHFFWPWVVVCIAYDLLCDGQGASVGKRLVGLRTDIVSADPYRHGAPCNVGRSLLRNAGWSVARLCYMSVFLAPLALAYDVVEVLLAAFSPSGRRLGDLLAGTQVVAAVRKEVL